MRLRARDRNRVTLKSVSFDYYHAKVCEFLLLSEAREICGRKSGNVRIRLVGIEVLGFMKRGIDDIFIDDPVPSPKKFDLNPRWITAHQQPQARQTRSISSPPQSSVSRVPQESAP